MLNTIFQSNSQRQIKKYSKIIKDINNYQEIYQNLSQKELQKKTLELKKEVQNGKELVELIPRAFALVKEATKRILGLNIYNVQLIAGIVLHNGQIAEMKTGEGKSLAAALPAYLNSLKGEGTHIITVNDYLAKRDSLIIGQIYKFLGLSVGLIQENMNQKERQTNYQYDITYVTNSEVAFDYLRDNMALVTSEVVHRPFCYAIVDEVDSIFIDEARTPLIIGGRSEDSNYKPRKTADLVKCLTIEKDYEVDYKRKTITLTEEGVNQIEHILDISDIYDIHNPWAPYLMNSLKAKELYKIGINYLIIDQQIVIVDEFTGRISQGRRWSEGLHQAIEAKENVVIQQEMKTLASITYQNFFLLYPKLAGMTGTAKTEDVEFDKIYKMQVIEIPTNQKMIRKDFPDLLYKNQYSKWKAVILECRKMHLLGRPILIGTTSISNSQLVSYLLKECGITHNVLNARPKNAIREGDIIAQAGRKKAVTIATNMAGRGTDIILGGNATQLTDKAYLKITQNIIAASTSITDNKISQILTTTIENYNEIKNDKIQTVFETILKYKTYFLTTPQIAKDVKAYLEQKNAKKETDYTILDTIWHSIYTYYKTIVSIEKSEVIQSGGLHIIGTERHDSRRIDNQLRGRAGRQGDPGSSRFFLSLDDKLLKNFGGSNINNIMESLKIEDDIPIESTILTNFLDIAQQKVESYYYDIRKHVFDYDQVLNDHRKAIYAERKRILEQHNLRRHIIGYGEATIEELVSQYVTIDNNQKPFSKTEILEVICQLLKIKNQFNNVDFEKLTEFELKNLFQEQIYLSYDLHENFLESMAPGLTRQLEKYILLTQIDSCWTKHLQQMNLLQEIITWRSYAQNDPLVEYKRESFILFYRLLQDIFQSVIDLMMKIEEAK